MDLGRQNILVDDDFNFIAIIDWEFAQTAPWQVNHYPMPFPLLGLDIEDILRDPSHLVHKNVLRLDFSRRIYNRKFQEAERELEERGRPHGGSFADTLNKPASRVDAELVRQMVQLAFGLDRDKAEEYIRKIEHRLRDPRLQYAGLEDKICAEQGYH
ncbi:unnamed protein product [Clonostachys chloroleuca]|uniref:Aminoglycoside phosphotransferase domain-containing protein n=1 Tax=Clonostachys chloroleuca TaxID=1926264 RepID=A0AA35MDU2_9HYPO|nr:unnamed protein product [Clonostachys chloroleuca]CAI6095305.1 unnamed protein product [Clonostachys chloroleuca]